MFTSTKIIALLLLLSHFNNAIEFDLKIFRKKDKTNLIHNIFDSEDYENQAFQISNSWPLFQLFAQVLVQSLFNNTDYLTVEMTPEVRMEAVMKFLPIVGITCESSFLDYLRHHLLYGLLFLKISPLPSIEAPTLNIIRKKNTNDIIDVKDERKVWKILMPHLENFKKQETFSYADMIKTIVIECILKECINEQMDENASHELQTRMRILFRLTVIKRYNDLYETELVDLIIVKKDLIPLQNQMKDFSEIRSKFTYIFRCEFKANFEQTNNIELIIDWFNNNDLIFPRIQRKEFNESEVYEKIISPITENSIIIDRSFQKFMPDKYITEYGYESLLQIAVECIIKKKTNEMRNTIFISLWYSFYNLVQNSVAFPRNVDLDIDFDKRFQPNEKEKSVTERNYADWLEHFNPHIEMKNIYSIPLFFVLVVVLYFFSRSLFVQKITSKIMETNNATQNSTENVAKWTSIYMWIIVIIIVLVLVIFGYRYYLKLKKSAISGISHYSTSSKNNKPKTKVANNVKTKKTFISKKSFLSSQQSKN